MTVTAAAGHTWGLSPEALAATLRQQSSHSQPGDGSHRCCLPMMDEGINLSRMHLIKLEKEPEGAHAAAGGAAPLLPLPGHAVPPATLTWGRTQGTRRAPRKSPGLWGQDPAPPASSRSRGTTAKRCRVLIQSADPAQHPSARIAGRLRPCSQTAPDETLSVLLQLAPCQQRLRTGHPGSDTMALPAPTCTAGWLGLGGPGSGWDAEPWPPSPCVSLPLGPRARVSPAWPSPSRAQAQYNCLSSRKKNGIEPFSIEHCT